MAEIIESRSSNAAEYPKYIVMFNGKSDEAGRKRHMDLVKRLSAHKAVPDLLPVKGITDVYDNIGGYAGQFPPEVVQWIKSQLDIQSVDEDGTGNID